jgi:hypothetical protein
MDVYPDFADLASEYDNPAMFNNFQEKLPEHFR